MVCINICKEGWYQAKMNGDKIQLDYSFWWFYMVKDLSPILINNIFLKVYSYTAIYEKVYNYN